MRSTALVGATFLAMSGLAGCGHGAPSPVVVRVGETPITKATVAHWVRAIEQGSAIGGSVGGSRQTDRSRALDFLISSAWLIGESEARGLAPSDGTVEGRLRQRARAVPNGRAEFERELSASGQTTADAAFEIRAELAAQALRAAVAGSVPAVTEAEVAAYYEHNLNRYRVPERRVVDLIENLPSRAAAVELGSRLGAGARFRKRALRELVARQTPAEARRRDNGELVRAIFAASPGTVSEPARFHRRWVLIVVRGTVPGSVKPRSRVGDGIAKRLSEERRRRAVGAFIEAYRSKWIARTDCSAGYVVQKCAQFHGAREQEGNPLLSG